MLMFNNSRPKVYIKFCLRSVKEKGKKEDKVRIKGPKKAETH